MEWVRGRVVCFVPHFNPNFTTPTSRPNLTSGTSTSRPNLASGTSTSRPNLTSTSHPNLEIGT